MKSIRRTAVFALCLCMVLCGLGLLGGSAAQAGPKIVKIEGVGFSVNKAMVDNIAVFKGKVITVALASGEVVTGKVVDVNAKFLHLTDLERTNFLDAFIDLSQVSAVKAQVRKYAND